MRFYTLVGVALALTLLGCSASTESTASLSSTAETLSSQISENIILGRPTDSSVTLSVMADEGSQIIVEYAVLAGTTNQTEAVVASSDNIAEVLVDHLQPDTDYSYRVGYSPSPGADIAFGELHSFRTQRLVGNSFSFGVQGDSHPERTNSMYSSDLYKMTMNLVATDRPDLYFMLGDDFSITGEVPRAFVDPNYLTQQMVDDVYLNQRDHLSIMANSTALFPVNGNHEESRSSLLNTRLESIPIFAGLARKRFFPLPYPNHFYSGNTEEVPGIGLLGDYFAFQWGDALFVSLDYYSHSSVVSERIGGQQPQNSLQNFDQVSELSAEEIQAIWDEQQDEYLALTRESGNSWDATLGDAQYQWLTKTLEESEAKYKFVFTHHVLGSGRGGVEHATRYEWGGYTDKGVWEFDKERPNWGKPIHQLFLDNGVTIVFQAHDHVFAHQELDGIVYQSVPNPADYTYRAFNAEAYLTGQVLPNSGFLEVSVSDDAVQVDYKRSFLPEDQNAMQIHGNIDYSYLIEQ